MLGIKYLNEDNLKGFEKYKYKSIDTSLLSVHVMHPFWNWCVQYFPIWMAPNLLTFSGFLLTVVNFILISYYDNGFHAADHEINTIPNWVWLVASINLFLAYTLDGIDGKQARRTGTSGPLGELFDHGLDSYSAVLIPIYMFSLFGQNTLSTIRMHFIILNIFLNFYLTHFEKYNTGVMFLPWGYDFTMWGVTIMLGVSWVFGPEIWHQPLPFGFRQDKVFEILLYVSAVVSSHPIIIKNIYISYRDGTGKMRPFLEAARPLFPLFSLFIITTLWVIFSPNQISTLEPRILFITFGTVFSNICSRLIVAQMSDVRTEGWNYLLWLLSIATLFCIFPYYQVVGIEIVSESFEKNIVYILAACVTLAHLHYGQGVVNEMCNHFHIRCFKVSIV